MRTKLVLSLIVLLIAGLAAGCAQPAAPAEPAQPSGGGPAALAVKGQVANELALTLDEVKALGVEKVTAEHPKKGAQEYEGVRVKAVLDKAGVDGGAADAVFTASDGFSGSVALADLNACADCLIAIDADGVLSMVLPGQPSSAWVKDVVSIEIK